MSEGESKDRNTEYTGERKGGNTENTRGGEGQNTEDTLGEGGNTEDRSGVKRTKYRPYRGRSWEYSGYRGGQKS